MGYNIIENGRVITVSDGRMPQYFVVNAEADKPANPSPGDIVKVLATTKEYTCFVTNLWSLSNTPCKDSYHNHTGVADTVAQMYSFGTGTNSSGVPHVRVLTCGDGVQHYQSWMYEMNVTPSSEYFIWNAKLGTITNGTGGNKETVIGLADSYAYVSIGNRTGCYFLQGYDDTWGVQTYDGSSGAENTLITAPVAGDNLTIVGLKSKILYLVNGVLVATHTNHIASGALFPLVNVETEDATITVERGIKIDYMGIDIFR